MCLYFAEMDQPGDPNPDPIDPNDPDEPLPLHILQDQPAIEMDIRPPAPHDPVLDQQPGPANQVELRPSIELEGERSNSTIYCDGTGFYYYSNKISNNRR
jgi:hypothetical protein